MAASGWFPDPVGLHEKRFFNGVVWTDLVSDGGHESWAPLGTVAPPSPYGTGPVLPLGSPYIVVTPQPVANGSAVAALTLGIIGAVLALTSPFGSAVGGICALLGLIFGLVGLRNVSQRGASGSGLAIAGVVLGSVGLVVSVYTGINFWRLNNAIKHSFSTPTTAVGVDANAALNKIKITSCYQVQGSGAPAASGTLVNTSHQARAFRVTVALHSSDETVQGVGTTQLLIPGETGIWIAYDPGASFQPNSCTLATPSGRSP
ncbi:MAG: hypothetical protein QOH10_2588 [Actinomycetota bacterium]|nr:hypothetical protein [Actinomycetota bacterium]